MLYKGKHGGYYFYELSDTDLLWDDNPTGHYVAGNVLLFRNKREIALGAEHIKADDLETAFAYLEADLASLESSLISIPGAGEKPEASLESQLAEARTIISKRDGLLRDLSSDLESQRYSNKMLIAQLEALREQISIEQLSRNEVLDDLEVASAETYRKDQELQAANDARMRLEQELAAQICELLELDSANAELQKRLEEQRLEEQKLKEANPHAEASTAKEADGREGACPSPASSQEPKETGDTMYRAHTVGEPGEPGAHKYAATAQQRDRSKSHEAQVYTMPTGKQIQIYHEFPPTKGLAAKRKGTVFYGAVRLVGLVVIGALLFVAGSVFATAGINDLSLGEALDATLKTVMP